MSLRFLGIEIGRAHKAADIWPRPDLGEMARVSASMGGRAYRDSTLTFSQIREMRKHPMVKFALRFIRMPLPRVSYVIQCEDEGIARFVSEALEPIMDSYLRDAGKCLDFGFMPFEIIWEQRIINGKPVIVLRPLKPLKPEDATIMEDDIGNFMGIEYANANGGVVQLFDAEGKALLVVNEKEDENRYGVSELEAVKKFWSRAENTANMAMRYMEGKADPIPVVRYDSDGHYESAAGVELDPRDIGYELGKNAKQGRPIALPSRTNDKGEFVWDIKYLESTDRSPVFRSMLEYFDTMILRGLLVPERSLTQATETGSYSMAESHGDFLVERQEDLVASLIRPLNDTIVPRLIYYNFGRRINCRIESGGLREQDKELARTVAATLIASPSIGPEQKEWLEKRTGIPFPKDKAVIITPDKPVEGREQLCDCGGEHITLSATKYWRPLKAFEAKVQLASLAGYLDGWLTETEALLISALTEIKTKYMRRVEWAMENYSKQSQLLAVIRGLEFKGGRLYQSTLYRQLEELMGYCARAACSEVGVKYQGLTPDAISWMRAQADATWYKQDGDIRAAVNFAVIEAINKGKGTKEVLWAAEQVWQRWLDPGRDDKVGPLMQTAVIFSSQVVNRGRQVAKDTYDDTDEAESDPIIAVQRSEVLDKKVCRYCHELLDQKVVDIKSPDYEEFFLVEPHPGCRGVNVFIRKSERFAADAMNDPKYKFKRPTKNQIEQWTKETR